MKTYVRTVQMLVLVALVPTFLACTPSPQTKDPAAITRAILENIDKGRADAAARYFAEDAEFTSGMGQPTGIKKIRDFFALNLIALKTHITVDRVSADGPNVTGIFTIQSAHFLPVPTSMAVIAQVVDGKVKSMTWTKPKD